MAGDIVEPGSAAPQSQTSLRIAWPDVFGENGDKVGGLEFTGNAEITLRDVDATAKLAVRKSSAVLRRSRWLVCDPHGDVIGTMTGRVARFRWQRGIVLRSETSLLGRCRVIPPDGSGGDTAPTARSGDGSHLGRRRPSRSIAVIDPAGARVATMEPHQKSPKRLARSVTDRIDVDVSMDQPVESQLGILVVAAAIVHSRPATSAPTPWQPA